MSLRLHVVLALLFLTIKGFGQQQPPLQIIADATSIPAPGGTLDVEVKFADFDALFGFTAYILWDSTVLEVDTIPFVDATTLPGFSRASISLPSQNNLNPEQGQTKVFWFSGAALSIPDSTHLFTMRFNVVGAPCDTTSFSIGSVGPLPTQMSEAIDANFEDIGIIINDDVVAIPGTNCDVLPPVGFDLLNVTTTAGSNICMPMVVSNFDSINSFSGSINYDATQLSYTGAQNFGITGFSSADVIDLGSGVITYTWIDQSTTNPETLTTGATLFEVCFDAVGAPGSTTVVQITDTPSAITVSMAPASPTGMSIPLEFTVDQGILNIQNVAAPDPLVLRLSNLNADAGTNVCMPITVVNFIDITQVSASTTWDPSVLQYTGVQGFNLPNFTSNNVNANNAATGSLGFTWSDITNNNPATLTNGNSIFEICFDVVGSPGASSDVDFTNSPMTIAATQDGTPPVDLMVNTQNGSVTANSIAAAGVTFILGNASGDCDDNVCIPITVDGFTNINSVNGSVMWDAAELSYTGLGTVNLPGLSNASGLNTNNVSNGMLGFSWLDLSGSAPVTLASGDTMLEVCFDVVGNTSNSSSVVKMTGMPTIISVSEQPANPADPSIQLDFTLVDGSFTTMMGCGGGSMTDVTFTVGSESGDCNDNVCVPILVDGFTDINSVNGSLMWDATALTYMGLGTVNLPGLSNASGLNTNNVANGMLGFSWLDLSGAAPVTLPSGGTMLEVCFDVTGTNSGASTIKMTGNPTIISVSQQPPNPADPSIQLDFDLVDGSFTIGSGCTTTMPVDSVEFIFLDVCAGLNDATVCVPLTVNNFERIAQVDFSLMWDPAVLGFDEFQNVALTGFNALSSLNVSMIADGQLSFSWFDDSGANPETVADGNTVMEVCFDVLGGDGSSSNITLFDGLSVGLTDIAIGQADTDPTVPVMTVPHTVEAGTVTMGGKNPGDFHLSVGEVTTNSTSELACVDFNVSGFTDIIITEWNIQWDPSNLCFNSVTNINTAVPSLTPIRFDSSTPGILKLAWSDPNLAGKTIPDGDTYYTVCFDNKMQCGGTTPVNVLVDAGQAAFFEVVAEENPTTPLAYTSDDGAVSVICAPGMLMFDGDASITNPSCSSGPQNTGSISVNYKPGTAPHNCSWTGPNGFAQSGICTGNNTTISALSPGTYFLTITDDNGVTISDSYVINNGPTINLNAVVTPVTCDAQGNITLGSIVVNPSGGQAPYTQTPTANNLIGLNVGSYPVVVRDANGCSTEQRFEILDNCVVTPINCSATATPATSCGCTGTITATATGGVGPYQFTYFPSISSVNAVCPGTYTITCTDSRGNSNTSTVFVGEIDMGEPQILISNIRPGSSCTGVGGGADIEISGGCPPYNCRMGLIVNGVKGGSMPCSSSNNILPGDYYVELIDNLGNIITETQFTIPELNFNPPVADVQVVSQPGPCSYDLEGSVSVGASAGCMPYSVDIIPSDGNAQNPSFLNVAANQVYSLPSGMYDVIVSDNSTAQPITTNITIASPPPAPMPGEMMVSDSCVVTLPFSGGNPPLSFEWYNSSDSLVGTGETINLVDLVNAVPDTVTITEVFNIVVRDTLGCVHNFTQTVECGGLIDTGTGECPLFWSDVLGGTTSCAGEQLCEGSVSGTIEQCEGFGPYTITVKDQAGQSFTVIQEETGPFMFSGLCAGSYGVMVTDAEGVDWNLGTNLIVDAPEPLVVDISLEGCDEDDNGFLEVEAIGGTEGYNYSWTYQGDTIGTDSPILENLEDGAYFLDVIDANGCLESKVYNIDCDVLPPPPSGDCEGTPVITPGNDDLNEVLFIDCVPFGDYELKVYDRWGRLVHGSLAYNNDWNGVDQDGSELGEGAYYWVLLSTDGDNTTVNKGTVTILRNR